MRTLTRLCASLGVLLLCLPMGMEAQAAPREANTHWLYVAGTGTRDTSGINGAALNGSPQSSAIDTSGWNVVTPTVVLTRVAATTLVLTCITSQDGTNYGSVPSAGALSSGAGNVYALVWTWPNISGSGTFNFPTFTVNARYMKCTLTGASAGASDLVTLQLLLGVV